MLLSFQTQLRLIAYVQEPVYSHICMILMQDWVKLKKQIVIVEDYWDYCVIGQYNLQESIPESYIWHIAKRESYLEENTYHLIDNCLL